MGTPKKVLNNRLGTFNGIFLDHEKLDKHQEAIMQDETMLAIMNNVETLVFGYERMKKIYYEQAYLLRDEARKRIKEITGEQFI